MCYLANHRCCALWNSCEQVLRWIQFEIRVASVHHRLLDLRDCRNTSADGGRPSGSYRANMDLAVRRIVYHADCNWSNALISAS
jgi:hypothetical protein